MTTLRTLPVLLSIVLGGCCTSPTPAPVTGHLAGGGRVAFVQLDLDVSGTPTPTWHALVTQAQRGELAVIDLESHAFVDSDERVPGVTFVRVGAGPNDIVVSGSRAYVSCFGGGDSSQGEITVLDTATLRGPTANDDAVRPSPIQTLGGRPSAMVLRTAGGLDSLVVALGETGEVAEVDPMTGAVVQRIAVGAPPGDPCNPLGEPSAPVGLALAPDGQTLYVGDAGQACLSVVDLAARTHTLIAVGGTTGRVAVSPDQRWVYAVDRDHGGVRVVDLTTGALVSPGPAADDPLLANPELAASPDLLDVPGVALDVAFVELTNGAAACGPSGDTERCPNGGTCVASARGDVCWHARGLNGLFALVPSSYGNVYVVNVRDDDDTAWRISRNLPHHIRNDTDPPVEPALDGDPVLYTAGGTPIELSGAFPHPTPIGVALGYFAIDQDWRVIYQGNVTGQSAAGQLVAPGELHDITSSFCRLWIEPNDVLIVDDPPPVATPPEISGDACNGFDCAVYGDLTSGPPDTRRIPITAVSDDLDGTGQFFGRLGLAPLAPCLERCYPQALRYHVRAPDGQWIVSGQAVGSGRALGLLRPAAPPFVPGAPCPTNTDPLFRFRAAEDVWFANPFIGFELVAAGTAPAETGFTWKLVTKGAVVPQGFGGGVLPRAVAFLGALPAADGQLFIVDSVDGSLGAGSGLVQWDVVGWTVVRNYD